MIPNQHHPAPGEIVLREGLVKKGGVNPPASTPKPPAPAPQRPAQPPQR